MDRLLLQLLVTAEALSSHWLIQPNPSRYDYKVYIDSYVVMSAELEFCHFFYILGRHCLFCQYGITRFEVCE